jgi:hypothetical protein
VQESISATTFADLTLALSESNLWKGSKSKQKSPLFKFFEDKKAAGKDRGWLRKDLGLKVKGKELNAQENMIIAMMYLSLSGTTSEAAAVLAFAWGHQAKAVRNAAAAYLHKSMTACQENLPSVAEKQCQMEQSHLGTLLVELESQDEESPLSGVCRTEQPPLSDRSESTNADSLLERFPILCVSPCWHNPRQLCPLQRCTVTLSLIGVATTFQTKKKMDNSGFDITFTVPSHVGQNEVPTIKKQYYETLKLATEQQQGRRSFSVHLDASSAKWANKTTVNSFLSKLQKIHNSFENVAFKVHFSTNSSLFFMIVPDVVNISIPEEDICIVNPNSEEDYLLVADLEKIQAAVANPQVPSRHAQEATIKPHVVVRPKEIIEIEEDLEDDFRETQED